MARNVTQLQPVAMCDPPPPEGLGTEGLALWHGICADFVIDDAALRSILEAACQARDMAAACAERIERDGLMIAGREGTLRDHPLVKQRIQALALVSRLLVRLGCTDAPPRSVGRPGGR